MSEVSKHTYWVLFDATTDVKFIKKTIPEGFLAFFDSEECARKSKARNSGTDYKRVDFVPESEHQRKLSEQAREIERLTAELGDGTTGKKYRAELYDEVWQKSRDMGYSNVTMALAELEQVKKAQGQEVPEECPHMIVFDDADRENEVFAGAGARPAALRRWAQISTAWNAHLFVRTASNSRDDKLPCATLTAPPAIPATQVLVERELLERVERYFSGFVSDEPPAYALGSNGLATIRAILSRKGGDV